MAVAPIFSWISLPHSLAQCPGALAGMCAMWKMRDSSCWALITPLGLPFMVEATAFCTGMSYLFGVRGCILLRSSSQGFKMIFLLLEKEKAVLELLLMLYNNKAPSLRRATAWQLDFLCKKCLCYQERRKSRLCTWLIWGRCFNPAVLINTHILVVWYLQQHKVSVLQCVRYPDCTSFGQMSSVKLVPYSMSWQFNKVYEKISR